jgi:hypothetical protein
MKNMVLSVALLLAFASGLPAQVTVQVLMDQDQFLPNESIPVKVRIVNNSGQTLRFGAEDWLSYSVEGTDGLIVLKTGDAPMAHNFEVRAAEMATTRADLAPCFDITKPGRYAVTATVNIQDWSKNFTSAPKKFDVVTGTRLWEQEFGVPQSPTNHGQPEVRKYILQQATLSRHTQLYFRLTNAGESRTLRVFLVGQIISFSDPQMRVDQDSNLHLVYQTGAHVYSYTVINPEGELFTRQTFYYANSIPRLRVDDTGKVLVEGGVRHFADNDLPPTRKSILTNDIPLPVR